MNSKITTVVLMVILFGCSQTRFVQGGDPIGRFAIVDLTANAPTLNFQPAGSGPSWTLSKFSNGLYYRTPPYNDVIFPFVVKDGSPDRALQVDQLGVGIGTDNPFEALHIYSNGSGYDEARMLIENDLNSTSLRTMLQLVNNGGARMVFDNTESGEAWMLLTNPADNFVISRSGSGGAELTVRNDGSFFVGPGNQSNLILSATGNLTIKGSLNQQSDRSAKRAFEPVDPQQILEQVTRLPITTWQYKDDSVDVRHIGPIAQDFRATFELGQDDKTIATVDSSGVALASIQALNAKLIEKDRRIDALQDEVADLKEQFAQLQTMVLQATQ